MRVAVVTAIHRPSIEWLRQCHFSVRAQTHPCTHILISDGSGPNPLEDFQGQFVELHHRHNDYGDTPRTLGALSAFAQGFDAVCWLDQDNWFYPGHVAALVALQKQSGAPVCTCSQDIFTLDGQLLGPSKKIEEMAYADANCYLVTREAVALVSIWALMPAGWHVCSDIYFNAQLRKLGVRNAHTPERLGGYRATRSHIYRSYGVEPPAGVKDSDAIWRKLVADGLIHPGPSPGTAGL
jgi:hypothetical protein